MNLAAHVLLAATPRGSMDWESFASMVEELSFVSVTGQAIEKFQDAVGIVPLNLLRKW